MEFKNNLPRSRCSVLSSIEGSSNIKQERCQDKDAVEAFRELFLLKANATFANFFLHKYKLNDQVDNTQILLRNAAPDRKIHYLHKLVMDTLKDVEIISQR